VPGRHLPPNPYAGDESTLAGYAAVHGRPAAFDGPDGAPYSVDIATADTGDTERPVGAFLLFLRWRRMGAPGVEAHVESEFLAYGATAEGARHAVGSMSLHEVKALLDSLVQERGEVPRRAWWDAMREEDGGA
jgi:hypothetical protein